MCVCVNIHAYTCAGGIVQKEPGGVFSQRAQMRAAPLRARHQRHVSSLPLPLPGGRERERAGGRERERGRRGGRERVNRKSDTTKNTDRVEFYFGYLIRHKSFREQEY